MDKNYEKIRSIPVRNEELIEILNETLEIRKSDFGKFEKYVYCTGDPDPSGKWIDDDYLKNVIGMGREHSGYPEEFHGYEMRMNSKDHKFFKNEPHEAVTDELEFRKSTHKKLTSFYDKIMNWMGCRNNALHAIYPPGGYISWHNNANAAAWNLIFTWSETGEGYFKYWDVEKKEVVYMQDKPGWQCKAGYFGHYGEPDKVFYHAASTKCWRHTVSYCFDRSETSREFREDLLNEISSE